MKPELRIVLVSDGKPGHFHLSDGICAAIARRRPVAVTRVEIMRPWWMPARALSAMSNAGGAAGRLAARVLGLDARPIPACDLVVSAGGDTLAANIALARTYSSRNIFYGSLRRYRPDDFALVLTSYAANANRPNHTMALKPSAFDPDTLPPRAPTAGLRPTLGLLIGGDSGTVRYHRTDWERLLGLLPARSPQSPRWVVSSSRRTPDDVSDAIAALAADAPGDIRFIDARRKDSGTLMDLFAASQAVAVTVDSSSMVSEAIWARRPVVALAPETAALPALEQGYRDYLATEGWISTLPLEEATPDALLTRLEAVRPLTTNPLDALADLIAARLPALYV